MLINNPLSLHVFPPPPFFSMANNLSLCLVGAMDRLWFQQIILFPDPFSPYFPLEPKQPLSESTTTSSSSSSLSLSSVADQEIPALDDPKKEEKQLKKRSRRGNLSRSHSPSQSTHKHQRINHQCKLQKSTSCRSLKDLELEEVKGFMDLGFVFTKEHLNARMISVIPGLLRLGFSRTKRIHNEVNVDADQLSKDDDIEQEEKRGVIRPYLSEAWLIKRPDSPLLNLRVPRVSAAADMKKHLKFWARTVAYVVQQDS